MLLARKPILPPMFPPTSHRRHPSAPPAVIVQPTKVPGILSISKPLRADSPRQHRQQLRTPQRTPKPKHTNPDSPKPPQEKPSPDSPVAEKPLVNKAIILGRQALSPLHPTSLDNVVPHAPISTPDKLPRGRQKKAPKDKTPARGSSAHGHSRRNNARQPSPPISSSQIEGPVFSPPRNPTANSFDPFIVSSDSDSDVPRPAFPSNSRATKLSPAAVPPPSGKSIRRRNQTVQPPATPSPASRPVPVPGNKHSIQRSNLSRSAPVPHALPRMDKRRASMGHADTDFPVCDDTTDVEDTSPPTTPARELPTDHTWQHLSLNGSRTASLSPFNVFSFASGVDSTPSRSRHHHHYRTPSDGVFNMSLDEDMSLSSDASDELKKFVVFPPKRFGSVGPSTSHPGKDKAGFFASSLFQNSPSPDELPPPAF